jgi:hypothetical protein
MKKFKLIKEYPNSVDLGTVTEIEYDRYGVQFAKYPEFWQEITEPQVPEYVKCVNDGSINGEYPNGKIYKVVSYNHETHILDFISNDKQCSICNVDLTKKTEYYNNFVPATKEEYWEYVWMNNPCLTFKEVRDNAFYKIIELAKQRTA